MAAAKPISTPKQPFDEAKLAQMIEPLTVRVERIKGHARTPIPMPDSDDPTLPPGSGWTKDNVREIENWLVTSWAGGGVYEITVTDSQAVPIVMKWSPYWDTRQYPEMVPPPLRDVAQQIPQIVPQQPMQPQVRPMTAFPNGLSGTMAYQQPYQQPQYAQPYGYPPPPQQYQLPAPPPVGTHQWPQWRDEAENRRREDEMRGLREREAAREREAIEAKHKAELEREKTANEARFAQLQTMITQLTQTITQQQTQAQVNAQQAKPNAEFELLQRQLADEKREREAERRDRDMKDQLKTIQEANQRQIDLLVQRMEQQANLAREANTNRHDPMIAMMQEQARLNADSMKEIARQGSDAISKLQAFMMTPAAMFDLTQRQSLAADANSERISSQYGRMIEMQQKLTENALQLAPGGTSALDVVRDGVNGVKEMIERYTGAKAASERVTANAQVEIARAQAHAVAAQASAVYQQQQPQHVYVPPAPTPQGQLAGTPDNVTPISSARKTPVERFGRTDREWFGPVFEEVEQLRQGVEQFMESAKAKPPRLDDKGELVGVNPEQAAMAILQAVQVCSTQNIAVQALADLLFVDRFDDFLSVVLPDAPKPYRDDVSEILQETAKRMTRIANGEDPNDVMNEANGTNGAAHDDDDADDDTDDDDDDPEVAPETLPEIIKPASKPNRR